jgi:hypothetical protein
VFIIVSFIETITLPGIFTAGKCDYPEQYPSHIIHHERLYDVVQKIRKNE